ncbi:MAG: hypothetical protein GYA51_07070, partial [Candidatus Methanofastidiosa archaeon]|nr:hypothetical protein [Candidatus Methanofastidiosa archaeon]
QAKGFAIVKSIKAVMTTSENLDDSDKDIIEKYFSAPVIDCYGARDGGIIAVKGKDCNGYHYNFQDCFVEEVFNNKLKENELILTNLSSLSMPLIRYRIGDLGELSSEKCSCGIIGPLIIKLYGRDRDLIRNNRGDIFHSSLINQLIKRYKGIRKYQIIQDVNNNLQVILRIDHDVNIRELSNSLSSLLYSLLDDTKIKIEIDFNSEFLLTSNYKFRQVISR